MKIKPSKPIIAERPDHRVSKGAKPKRSPTPTEQKNKFEKTRPKRG